MNNFEYSRPETAEAAIAAVAGDAKARFLAGGTTLIDLMKCDVEAPTHLVDVSRLPGLDAIEVGPGGIRIGAAAKMTDVAEHPAVARDYPGMREALLLGASTQLRNMASIGGNLMQRTRCSYFRDPSYAQCNKRKPGSGCAAIDGVNRGHAILGTSELCIATYPGDFAVSLMALDATVHVQNGRATAFPIDDFFLPYGPSPHIEHPIGRDELIVAVEVPASAAARRSHYLKVRDRESYEFAACSAAVGLELEPDGRTVRDVRVALGGVASKPWRARQVEAALRGKTFDEPTIRRACELAVEGAKDWGHNGFKITLAPRVAARALMQVGGLE
ncbi:FAD binding domain-containing protein [Sphingomonas lenta]|uniref:FAD-binding molybdopterin dehydrogenase n=1 Tax=Sphingomonas lenta TaxID=1141887 RepID=A0A2A2SHW0_9SPHN|nr:xanthine dehydrogenase family protein subunit M [Sphingomonas lenta]PAX08813.1 FAD-binding molybdopterin dehydrogenase [Sphingomonas lenta]